MRCIYKPLRCDISWTKKHFFGTETCSLRWPNTAFAGPLLLTQFSARTVLHKNKHGDNTVIILFAQCLRYTTIFFTNEHNVLMVLLFCYKGMLEKGNDAKNPAILSFCLLPKEPS